MQEMPSIGCTKDEIDTPALCLDLDLMDANTRSMVDTCRRHKIDWRPHAKCHKSSWIARRLVEAGAIGVTCAKLGEAETIAAGGVHDVLIANLIVGRQKLKRLTELTRSADVIVCIDDIAQAEAISATMHAGGTSVRVLVEVNIGLNRVGVEPGRPALKLVQDIVRLPGIRFAGLMAYEGHLLTIEDQRIKADKIREAISLASDTRKQIEDHDIECSILSCGGTGSYVHTAALPGVTELQAGGAIFMDAYYRDICRVESLEYALTAISTVVGRPTADRVIIDAGRKTLNTEINVPKVIGRDDIQLQKLSAEHGILRLHGPPDAIKIGDRLELVPGYADLTVNLHDYLCAFRNGRLERIIPIEARGYVR